jgi:glyceraldehyde 3-phosphate dehydrogenase
VRTRIAINGFGRVGRNIFKIALNRDDIEIVAVNDIEKISSLAYLLKYDTNYGTYQRNVEVDGEYLIVDDKRVQFLHQSNPELLPWRDMNIDVAIESTGRLTAPEKARIHVEAGAKKVLYSAPIKEGSVDTIVIGVNEDKLKSAGDVISASSCTTSCITPILDILNHNYGLDKAVDTTIHSYTSTQRLVDSVSATLRESRAAGYNIIPTNTSADVATEMVLSELAGKFAGLSLRVPTLVVSAVDLTVIVKNNTTADDVKALFKKNAEEPYYQGILSVTEEELVSSDFVGNSHSAIIDLGFTKVVGGNLVKIFAWCDNEWAFSNRMAELASDIGKIIHGDDESIVGPEEAHISEEL